MQTLFFTVCRSSCLFFLPDWYDFCLFVYFSVCLSCSFLICKLLRSYGKFFLVKGGPTKGLTVHSINILRNCTWDKLGRNKVKITILFYLTRKELLVSLKEVKTKMPPELTERQRPTGVLDLIHESAVVEGRIYGLPVFVCRGSKSVEGGLKNFTQEGRWQSLHYIKGC